MFVLKLGATRRNYQTGTRKIVQNSMIKHLKVFERKKNTTNQNVLQSAIKAHQNK